MTPASNNLNWKQYIALALACFILYLPGIASVPPTDRDEARFAQASKQMVESGDYADIRYQTEPRYKKPIGIYWLQAAAVKITNAQPTDIWAYRIPSLLAAIGSVLLTATIGARLFGAQAGLIAAALLAGSLLLNVEARLAKTDAMLLFTVMAAQYALISVWLNRARSNALAAMFWIALAAGVLVKGPIIFIPVIATLAGLCWRERSGALFKNLAPAWGIPLLILLVAPWLVAISIKSHGMFWQASVGQDMLGKVARGQESHFVPPGYHAIMFWVMFWPGTILAFLALPFVWRERKTEKIAMLLLWLVPAWIVFEAVPTKLPHYTLPTYPAIALLTAAAWQYGIVDFKHSWLRIFGWVIWGATSLGIILAIALLPTFAANDIAMWQLLAATFSLCLLLWWGIRGDTLQPARRAGVLALASAIFMIPLFGITMPNFNYIWIAQQVRTATEFCEHPRLISARFNEPSLVFLMGTDTQLNAKGDAAANFLATARAPEERACNFALVDQKQWPAFTQAAAAQGIGIEKIADIKGFSYGGGDAVDMQLVRRGY